MLLFVYKFVLIGCAYSSTQIHVHMLANEYHLEQMGIEHHIVLITTPLHE